MEHVSLSHRSWSHGELNRTEKRSRQGGGNEIRVHVRKENGSPCVIKVIFRRYLHRSSEGVLPRDIFLVIVWQKGG